VITKCPYIDNEMRDGFVKHVGQQMLGINFVEQQQQRKYIQNNIKEMMQEIVLGEKQNI
jgi:hypothetical protein